MNAIHERLLGLLSSLDEICRKKRLRYCLAENVAFEAFMFGELKSCATTVEVLMSYKDALAFRKAVLSRRDSRYVIDSPFDNENYPELSMRYVDTQTAAIDLNGNPGFVAEGICVRIGFLRRPSKDAGAEGELCKLLERGWVANNKVLMGSTKYGFDKSLGAVRMTTAAAVKTGKADYLRIMLDLFEKVHKNVSLEDSLATYKPLTDNEKVFGVGVFGRKGTAELCGKVFGAPAKMKSYMVKMYGHYYETRKPVPSSVPDRLFVDPIVSYRDIVASFDGEGEPLRLDLDSLTEEKRLVSEYQAAGEVISEAWFEVLRSADRIALYQLYMPRKAEILKHSEQEDWKQLGKDFEEYEMAAYVHYRRGLALYFDEELHEAFLKYLRHGKKNALASFIEKNVPDEHRGTQIGSLIGQR